MLIFMMLGAIGFLMLLLSLVFGDHGDLSAEHEFGFEHGYEGGDGDHENSGGPSPFSMRVIAIVLVFFSVGGSLARYYDVSYMTSSLIGVAAGLIAGFLAFQFVRILWKQQASSTASYEDMIGITGEVKTAIPSSGLGEISIVVKQRPYYLSARSKNGQAIPQGATVKIMSYPGDSAVVETVQE